MNNSNENLNENNIYKIFDILNFGIIDEEHVAKFICNYKLFII